MQIFLYRLFPQNAAASDGIPCFLLRFHHLAGNAHAAVEVDAHEVGAGWVRAEVDEGQKNVGMPYYDIPTHRVVRLMRFCIRRSFFHHLPHRHHLAAIHPSHKINAGGIMRQVDLYGLYGRTACVRNIHSIQHPTVHIQHLNLTSP